MTWEYRMLNYEQNHWNKRTLKFWADDLMTRYSYKTQLHFNSVCVVMKSRFPHAHSEHRLRWFEPAAWNSLAWQWCHLSSRWPCDVPSCPCGERHAGKVTILLETQGTGGNYLTLPLWETPSATPASSKIYWVKKTQSLLFLIFPEMILSSVFKNTWDNKLYI